MPRKARKSIGRKDKSNKFKDKKSSNVGEKKSSNEAVTVTTAPTPLVRKESVPAPPMLKAARRSQQTSNESVAPFTTPTIERAARLEQSELQPKRLKTTNCDVIGALETMKKMDNNELRKALAVLSATLVQEKQQEQEAAVFVQVGEATSSKNAGATSVVDVTDDLM